MARRKKPPYFAHHWQAIKDCPDKLFPSLPYLQFMDWKVANWDIPSSVECIVRCTDLETKKVTEYTYQRRGFAERKIQQLMAEGRHEFVVVDHENCTSLYPEDLL